MKAIFSKIWLIWCLIGFVLSWFWVWPSYQIARLIAPGDKIYRAAFQITKIWGKVILFWIGVRVKVFGKENQYGDRQVVYVCNHRSQIDIPINFVSTPQFVILSKAEAAKIPVVGTNLKLGHVIVNRKDKESRKQSIMELKDHLRAGRSVLLYPEGRRPREEVALGDFHDGAFTLAKEFELPIVPITIIGSDKINNPKNPFSILPGKVEVYFDSAIEVNHESSVEELKQEVIKIMIHRLTTEDS